MKERPILFSGPMVHEIIEGRKTQTRRLRGLEDVNQYPGRLVGNSALGPLGYRGLEVTDYNLKPSMKLQFKKNPGLFHWFLGDQNDKREINPIPVKCPYGQVGDRLWVKETWQVEERGDAFLLDFRADPGSPYMTRIETTFGEIYANGKWRASIHMPRWASRIDLEITDIRVELVQEISTADATAEGCHSWPDFENGIWTAPDEYAVIWDEINLKRGYPWSSNPWVWVIDFSVSGIRLGL